MKHPAARHSGFTLIELLVTIGIIGVLAALIGSAVPKAQNSAKQAASMSNLRQLGLTITSYTMDKGHYPPATDGVDWRGYWSDSISPYMEKDSWWNSNPSKIIDAPAKLIRTQGIERAFLANPNVMPDMLWGGVSSPVKVTQVQRPVETILLADGVQHPQYGWMGPHMWQMNGIYDSSASNADDLIPATENLDNDTAKIRFRYNNQAMILFADGHTEYRMNGTLKKRNFAVAY